MPPSSLSSAMKRFFVEQDEHMNMSDDDFEEYEARMIEVKKKREAASKNIAPTEPLQEVQQSGAAPSQEMSARTSFRSRSSPPKSRLMPFSGRDILVPSSSSSSPVERVQAKNITPSTLNKPPHTKVLVVDTPTMPIQSATQNLEHAAKSVVSHANNVFSSSPIPDSAPELSASTELTSPPMSSTSSVIQDQTAKQPNTSKSRSKAHPKTKQSEKSSKAEVSKTKAAQAKEARQLKAMEKEAKRAAEKAAAEKLKRESQMTPSEYAKGVQEKWATQIKATPEPRLYLRERVVMYIVDERKASETTRKRLDILAKRGATVLAEYDATLLTHIIIAELTSGAFTLSVVGLRKLLDIPDAIKTVTWQWAIASGKAEHEIFYEAFAVRIKINSKAANRKRKRVEPDISFEHHDSEIEQYVEGAGKSRKQSREVDTRPLKKPGGRGLTTAHKVNTQIPHDPLAEFYSLAAQMDDDDLSTSPEDEITEKDVKLSRVAAMAARPKGKTKGQYQSFQCMQVPSADDNDLSPNQLVIDKLKELMDLHEGKPSADDQWRVFSYRKAIGQLRRHPTKITTFAEARAVHGIGAKTAEKIMEILNTGDLKRIKYETTPDVVASKIFTGIYGVGPKVALSWYQLGLRTLEDVKKHKKRLKLTPAQEAGLKYYEDINTRIPREEAKKIFDIVKETALSLDPDLRIEIMGSYRRGRDSCGDIDILITRPNEDGKTHKGILRKLLTGLHQRGALKTDLSMPDDLDDLEAKYMGLCQLIPGISLVRRIDILTIPYEQWGAALLYFTGDSIFNRSMRLLAHKKGMALNQRGLYSDVVRDPKTREKVNEGILVASRNELEIFDALGVPWQEPHQRIRA